MVVNKKYDDYDVDIGRGSIWGNPFVIGKHGTREEVIGKYRVYFENNAELNRRLGELVGKVLGCSCFPEACHGDILEEALKKIHKYTEHPTYSGPGCALCGRGREFHGDSGISR